jgi:hypothetical protein
MEELLKVIYAKLIEVTASSYFDIAPTTATFPFLTFKLPNSSDVQGCQIGSREDFILEVDVWDNIKDTARLEALTTAIETELQRERVINSYVSVSFFRINRLMLDDPDEAIKRRQLRFRVATWFIN